MRSTIFVLTVLIAACSSPTSDSDADAGAASAPTLASETTSSSTTAAATETPPTLAAAEEEIDTGFGAIAGFWDASVDENGRRDIIFAEHTLTGEVMLYDYQNDALGIGKECHVLYKAQLTSLGNNQYKANGTSEVAEMVVQNNELTVTSVLSEVSRTMPRLQGLDRTVPLCDGS